jgi:tRNA/tmRNA/rRNA uracil-C5-methylase (TrmA/RlmC/RlmD family)
MAESEERDGTLEVDVGSAVAGGRCLARLEGKVVLVAGAIPGERVRVRITRDERRWAEAEVVSVTSPSPGRREPPCPHAADCGGCDLQHASREAQLAMKRDLVVDAFRRIGRLDVAAMLEGPRAGFEEFRSRNRIAVSYASIGLPGLKRRASHDVVPIRGCLQVPALFDDVILPWLRMQPPARRASVRFDARGTAVVLFETGDAAAPREARRLAKILRAAPRPDAIAGILVDGVPVAGGREMRYVVGDRELGADATSFFQGTSDGARELVETVAGLLGEDRRGLLLDVYAGVGLFASAVGRGFERVVAGETDPRAVRFLARNLHDAGIDGEARAERAEYTLAAVPRGDPETVILDPPRTGLSREARRSLVVRAPRRIVAVSCDVATGARDVGELVREGWRLARLAAVDLFPTTAHVETAALLLRDAA